jgi:hypothetical protein
MNLQKINHANVAIESNKIDRNSRRNASATRIKGIINMAGVKWREKEEMIIKEITFSS